MKENNTSVTKYKALFCAMLVISAYSILVSPVSIFIAIFVYMLFIKLRENRVIAMLLNILIISAIILALWNFAIFAILWLDKYYHFVERKETIQIMLYYFNKINLSSFLKYDEMLLLQTFLKSPVQFIKADITYNSVNYAVMYSLPIVGTILYYNYMKYKLNPATILLKKHKEYKPDFSKAIRDKANNKINAVTVGVDLYLDGKTPVAIEHSQLSRHVCIVGTTGSGKTVTLYNFIDNSLLHKKPIIFLDGKGDKENIKKFKEHCRSYGKKARIITIDGKNGYNPFAIGKPTELKDKIISMFDWTEAYYKEVSGDFLQRLIQLMQIENITVNFENLIKYSNLNVLKSQISDSHMQQSITDSDPLASIDAQTISKNTINPKIVDILDAIMSMDKKAIDGLRSRLANVAQGDSADMFNAENPLILKEAIQNNEAVLFSLNSLNYSEQSTAVGRLIINDIKTCVNSNNGKPVSLFFDEFNVFASHQVIDLINKSRSAGFETTIAFQSLSDVDKIAVELRRQIMENCNTLIVQCQNETKDASELAELLGTKEQIAVTVQSEDEFSTGKSTSKLVRDFIVHPEEIKGLKIGEGFIKYNNKVTKAKFLH